MLTASICFSLLFRVRVLLYYVGFKERCCSLIYSSYLLLFFHHHSYIYTNIYLTKKIEAFYFSLIIVCQICSRNLSSFSHKITRSVCEFLCPFQSIYLSKNMSKKIIYIYLSDIYLILGFIALFKMIDWWLHLALWKLWTAHA